MASYTTTGQADQGMPPYTEWHPVYFKQTYRKAMFTLNLSATTTGISAGNLIGASAAASLQFALINPATSTKNIVLTKFNVGIISGTAGAGPLFHGFCVTPPTAASPGGTIRSNFLNDSTASVATAWVSAGGATSTGATAPVTFRQADFSSTNTAQASVGVLKTTEILNGDIIIPPGIMWLPLWSAAGTSLLNAYSITWYEIGL